MSSSDKPKFSASKGVLTITFPSQAQFHISVTPGEDGVVVHSNEPVACEKGDGNIVTVRRASAPKG